MQQVSARPLPSASEYEPSVAAASPRRLARIAGVPYLINIIGGGSPSGFVNNGPFRKTFAVTAHNIQSHELLYRAGLVGATSCRYHPRAQATG
jgi:hypothetical protein